MSRVLMLHVRFKGKSYDIPLEELDLTRGSSDHEIRERLTQHFDIGGDILDSYVIERHPDGNITIRPEAVFGVTATETDYRARILDSLLTTPHKKKQEIERIREFQQQVRGQDPIFFGKLALWYQEHGVIRDHKEMFLAHLLTSGELSHREAGFVLLQKLPPFQIARIVKYMKENMTSFPRSAKTAVTHFLHNREKDDEWFDSVAVIAKKDLKYLYAIMRLKPSPRAQQILFENNPPLDSKAYGMKKLAKTLVPSEQAKLIVTHRLPFRAVVGALKVLTPAVLVALIQSMSPQDVINNLGMLSKHGAFNNAEITALVMEKLEKAKSDERVAAFKTAVAGEAIRDLPNEIRKKLDEIRDTRVKARGSISRPTSLLVDKSASMETAIEVGKQLGSLISGIMEEGVPFFVYAFDNMAYPITAKGRTMADWEHAFKGINAGNNTSCGAALEYMRKKKQSVEQIIMVTDEEENTPPAFVRTYLQYSQELGITPHVVLLKVGGRHGLGYLQRGMKDAGVAFDLIEYAGDYYSLPGVVDFLTRPSRLDLLMEIMELELPAREDLKG